MRRDKTELFELKHGEALPGSADQVIAALAPLLTDERNPVNASGIYLYDAFGNLTLLHRDPAISSANPIPLRPSPPENAIA